jgi:O-antigen ligase
LSLGLPLISTLMFLYSGISVLWNGRGERDQTAMLFTLVGGFAAYFLSYILVKNKGKETLHRFLWWLTIGFAFVGLIYSAESFLSLGLRTASTFQSEFGIERVRGPLFGSSTGHFILIPALAFAIQEIFRSRKQFLFKVGIVFVLLLTLVSLGSRAALLIVGVFFMLLLLSIRGKQRIYILLGALVIAIPIMQFVFSQANTSRLESSDDGGRGTTYTIAGQIILNRPLTVNLFGSGYGSYWSWYLEEQDYVGDAYLLWKKHFRGVWTPYGRMLYHPHSSFVVQIVETGLPGILYCGFLLALLGRLIIQGIRGSPFSILAIGMGASGLCLFFDLFIFRAAALNALWWIYLSGAIALNSKSDLS